MAIPNNPQILDSFSNANQCPRSGDYFEENHSLSSSGAHVQMLLTALRNMIVPLVQTAMPEKIDLCEVALVQEADKFLSALQSIITSIVDDRLHSSNKGEIVRKVGLQVSSSLPVIPNNTAVLNVNAIASRYVSLASQMKLTPIPITDKREREKEIIAECIPLAQVNPTLFNEATSALRVHVFNELPIRLLSFHKRGSNLEITLLDREGIYLHLASKMTDTLCVQPGVPPLTFSHIKASIEKIGKYAILSHRWFHSTPGEVTYSSWHTENIDETQPGYQKLVKFCTVAAEKYGYSLGWMDTVCIDKSSSSELDESIRSMYRWYEKAGICITYLAETTLLAEMATDPWFTRGWTLQELLAPRNMKFYGSDWKELVDSDCASSPNDKDHPGIKSQIMLATTISSDELSSFRTDRACSPISRRMQWATNRQVTRGEDAAYSLMGIFNVDMPTAYGEGHQRAFLRLLKEILNSTKHGVLDLFNWGGKYESGISALLPSSPHAYLQRYADETLLDIHTRRLPEPVLLTHLGVRILVVLFAAEATRPSIGPFTPIGDYYATVNIHPILTSALHIPVAYNILDIDGIVKPAPGSPTSFKQQIVFAVLNSGYESPTALEVPRNCFAIALLYKTDNLGKGSLQHRIFTKVPIVFQLQNKELSMPSTDVYAIERNQLMTHGMFFSTISL